MHVRSGPEAWRLGALTDLSKLPRYSDYGRLGQMRDERGGAAGEPGWLADFPHPAASWDARQNRRPALALVPAPRGRAFAGADAAKQLCSGGSTSRGVLTSKKATVTSPRRMGTPARQGRQRSAVRELPDNQSFAHLVTGIKRITLPDEFNLYQAV